MIEMEDRIDFSAILQHRPNLKQGRGAELGVLKGDYTSWLAANFLPRELHLVDKWEESTADPQWKDYESQVREKFSRGIEDGWVHVYRSDSIEWLKSREEASLDWIYIDTSHDYDTTKTEILFANQVVRPGGGIIMLHDFVVCRNSYWRSGVVRAALQAVYWHNLKPIAITNEDYPTLILEKQRQ